MSLSDLVMLTCICPGLAKQLYPLFVSHSPDFNGAEKALVDQACALRDQGVLAHIVVPDEGPLEERLTELGISHGDVGEYYFMVNRTGEDPALDSQKNKTNIETSVAIAQLTERINPTAIVNNSIVNPWGYPAARFDGLPLFWMVHEYGDIDHALEFEHGLSVIREFIVKESEAVFCASESIKQSLLTRDNSLDKKVVVTYNLINESAVEALSNAVIKQPFTGGKSTVKLCIVGMVKERKGQVIAIKAVDALRKIGVKAELLVIGDGSKE